MTPVKRKVRPYALFAVVALVMAALAVWSDRAMASNMGFKINKQIVKGVNLVALPFRSQPLVNAKDICLAFGKTTSQTTIQQFPGPSSYTCDQLTVGFPLAKKGVGIRIVESGTGANAILVGSHIDHAEPGGVGILTHDCPVPCTPPFALSITSSPFLYGYPYHAVSQTVRDICAEMGKSGVASVALFRYGPLGVVDGAYTCDQITAGFPLRLGEALLITGAAGTTFTVQHY